MNTFALFSHTVCNFPGINGALSTGTDLEVAKHCDFTSFKLTDDAKALVYAAGLAGIDTSNPGRILGLLPSSCLEVVQYTFFIVCDLETYEDVRTKMKGTIHAQEYDEYAVLLASGSLGDWRETLLLFLNKHVETSFGYRVILNKLYKFLDRRGLKLLFTGYSVKNLPDHTFLLEG